MGNKKKLTNEEIKTMHNRINKGEKVKNICQEFGISTQAFYLRKKELNLLNKRDIKLPKDTKNMKINDMYTLAELINTDFDTIHKYVNLKKDLIANKKKMNYLKNNNIESFDDFNKLTVLNYYNISTAELIRIMQELKR